jgi:hypothetical protein
LDINSKWWITITCYQSAKIWDKTR